MSQKIIKIGSSQGVTLSRKALEQIGLQLGEAVIVEYDRQEQAIIIKAESTSEAPPELQHAAQLAQKFSDEIKQIENAG